MALDENQQRLAREIGRRVKTFREEQGLSQEKLGAKAGVTGATVSLTELGKSLPTIDTLERLGDALNVRIVDFFLGIGVDRQTGMKYFRSYLFYQGLRGTMLDDCVGLANFWIDSAQEPTRVA